MTSDDWWLLIGGGLSILGIAGAIFAAGFEWGVRHGEHREACQVALWSAGTPADTLDLVRAKCLEVR